MLEPFIRSNVCQQSSVVISKGPAPFSVGQLAVDIAVQTARTWGKLTHKQASINSGIEMFGGVNPVESSTPNIELALPCVTSTFLATAVLQSIARVALRPSRHSSSWMSIHSEMSKLLFPVIASSPAYL